MMTIYEKHLAEQITGRYPALNTIELMEKLIEMGVVDFTKCKVLAIRTFVDEEMRRSTKKIDAMWMASERFSCSYEYVRKCVYYYRDVNMV